MEIKFISRKEIIDKILDDLNNSKDKTIDNELRKLLIDLSK